MLDHPTVKYRTEQAVAIVTIDRYDEARNAVNPETAQGLAQAFRAFDRDPARAARSAPASTSSAPRPAIAATASRTATARWARRG